MLRASNIRLELSSNILVPHAFVPKVLINLFYQLHNDFLAGANDLMQSVRTVLTKSHKTTKSHKVSQNYPENTSDRVLSL